MNLLEIFPPSFLKPVTTVTEFSRLADLRKRVWIDTLQSPCILKSKLFLQRYFSISLLPLGWKVMCCSLTLWIPWMFLGWLLLLFCISWSLRVIPLSTWNLASSLRPTFCRQAELAGTSARLIKLGYWTFTVVL